MVLELVPNHGTECPSRHVEEPPGSKGGDRNRSKGGSRRRLSGYPRSAPHGARFQPGSLKYRGHRPYTPLQECCQANSPSFKAFLFRRLPAILANNPPFVESGRGVTKPCPISPNHYHFPAKSIVNVARRQNISSANSLDQVGRQARLRMSIR